MTSTIAHQNKQCRVQGCRHLDSHVTAGHTCGTCGALGHGQLECGNPEEIHKLRHFYGGDIISREQRCTLPGCRESWTHTNEAHKCTWCADRAHECPVPDANLHIKCPVCRTQNIVLAGTHTGIKGLSGECVVCYTNPPEVFLPACKHVNICLSCAKELDESPYIRQEPPRLENYIKTIDDCTVICPGIAQESRILDGCQDAGGFGEPVFIRVYAGLGHYVLVRQTHDRRKEAFIVSPDERGQYGTDMRPWIAMFTEGYREISTPF